MADPKPTPPNNLAAEAAVLGAILFDNNFFTLVRGILDPEHFYAPAHQHIYQVCGEQIGRGLTADGVTLREHFEAEGQLKEIGGSAYLIDLLEAAAFGPEVRDYCYIIRDMWTRRAMMHLGAELQTDAYQMRYDRTAGHGVAEAWVALEEISKKAFDRRAHLVSADEVMASVIGRIRGVLASGKPLPSGVSTGLAVLDEQIGKMHGGDLIILAGRPGMGKTAMALHLAHRSFRRDEEGFEHPARVAFFSLEMDEEPLAHRVMSMATRMYGMGKIPYRNIRKGRVGQSEAATLEAASGKLPKTVAWNTSGEMTLSAVESGCRQATRLYGGLDLVVIDYLQLIEFDKGWGENMASAIGRISSGLKKLAKKLGVPIVCLSQLSRAVEQRDNKRPMLSDLRESGAIEQDADAVIFCYRDEYYITKEEPRNASKERWAEWESDRRESEGALELICAKVRQGRVGTVTVHIELETNTIAADRRELKEETLI